jgi:hypothetical protein
MRSRKLVAVGLLRPRSLIYSGRFSVGCTITLAADTLEQFVGFHSFRWHFLTIGCIAVSSVFNWLLVPLRRLSLFG